MTRNARWKLILDLIRVHDVVSEDDLMKLLKENGANVSLAVVRRDIRTLNLVYALRMSREARSPGLIESDDSLGIEIPDYYSPEKQVRHRMIIELFIEYGSMTQMALVEMLARRGICVRQATVSRDLMELRSYVPDDIVSFTPPRPRISEDVRSKVLSMKNDGLSVSEIANECSISIGSVTRIIAGSKGGGM